MKKLLKCISNRLFDLFSVDPRSLAFSRTCVGILLLATYLNYVPYIDDYFNDYAITGRRNSLDATQSLRFSLYLINGHPLFPRLLLLLSTGAALLLITGVYSRFAAIMSLLLFHSLTVASDSMNFGLHYATNCILFWTAFYPYKKIPRWVTAKQVDPPFFSFAAVGMILTALTICIGAGLVKARDLDFWIFRAEAIQQFSSYYTNINPLTQILMQFPGIARFMTRATIVVEMLCVPMLFIPFFTRRLRIISLIVSTVFFLNASLFIHVGVFPLVPLAAMYAFIPAQVWEWMFERPRLGALLRGLDLTRFWGKLIGFAERLRLAAAARILSRVAIVIFIFSFAASIWNNYSPEKMKVADGLIHRKPVWDLLELSSLNRGWDFMYGGKMTNRFMIVEYRVGDRLFYRNPTHVDYRWPMFNYEMNYANSIMRTKDDADKLRHYAENLCRRGRSQARLEYEPAQIALYEIYDRTNHLGAFTEFDQDLIRDNIKGRIPFLRFDCRGNNTIKPVLPSHDDQPLTLEEFPIVGWQQDYGNPELNRSVDGNSIRLGGQQYDRGLGTHANSVITVAVRGARRFTGMVGIDSERSGNSKASVVIEVFGDNRLLFRSSLLTGSSAPVKVDVSVADSYELRLIAHGDMPGGNTNSIDDDHVSWGAVHLE